MTGVACATARLLVSAHVDGELTGREREDFEAHLGTCPSCQAAVEDDREVVSALRAAVPLYPVRAGLRRTAAEILRSPAPGGLRHPEARVSVGAWVVSVAAAFGVALLAGILLARSPRPAAPPVSELASFGVRAHQGEGGWPLGVQSEKPQEVARWFDGRAAFRLDLPEVPGEKPYTLLGGRLVSLRDRPVAHVVYRIDGRPVSLIVASAATVRPAGGTTVASGGLEFHLESVGGLRVITWTDRGLTYALVSEIHEDRARSCLVCHGSSHERSKLDGLRRRPTT